jgi:arylsulfatase A-like enzyme
VIFDSTALVVLLLLFVGAACLLHFRSLQFARKNSETTDDRFSNLRARAGEILTIAAWFGGMTGTAHLLEAFIQRFVRGHFLFAGPAMVWMTPLAYTLIFSGFGLVLGIAAYVVPRRVSLKLAIVAFSWLGLFALLLPFVQLHKVASFVLAAGFAVHIGRTMDRHPAQWLSTMRKTGLMLAVVVAVMAVATHGWIWGAEALAIRRLGPAPVGKPNVLLIVLDTVRAANLSVYGYDRPTTPELDRVARDGVTFEMALSTAPWTLKSHATMFSGLYSSQVPGGFEDVLRVKDPMLAEIFLGQGYLTGGFVANLLYTSYESGLTRGFVRYDDFRVSVQQVPFHSWIAHTPIFRQGVLSRSPSAMMRALTRPRLGFEPNSFHNATYERKSADQITDAFLQWQQTAGERPFFAFLNYFDAHQPFQPLPSHARRFDSAGRKAINNYDSQIAYIDSEVGRLLGDLDRRGVLENTIVVITSDHGEQFGEHGLEEHANSLYLPLLHVPLIIRYPAKVPKGMRVAEPVTLRDLAATIMDLAAMAPRTPGVSWGRLWNGGEAGQGSIILAELDRTVRPKDTEPSRFGPMKAVFDGEFHYIRRGDGQEELYAYRTDVAEEQNLGKTPEGEAVLMRLRALSDIR